MDYNHTHHSVGHAERQEVGPVCVRGKVQATGNRNSNKQDKEQQIGKGTTTS
jgi:hypothetical protein